MRFVSFLMIVCVLGCGPTVDGGQGGGNASSDDDHSDRGEHCGIGGPCKTSQDCIAYAAKCCEEGIPGVCTVLSLARQADAGVDESAGCTCTGPF
jgi:hypothetical protein